MSGAFQQFKQSVNRWIPDKNKSQFFLVFIVLSASFWLLTRFSNIYTAELHFNRNYTSIPTGIVVEKEEVASLKMWIRATGFQLLWYNLWGKTLDLDLQNAVLDGTEGRLDLIPLRGFLEAQLFENAQIIRMQPNTLVFKFESLLKKQIPILLSDAVQFKTGYQYSTPPKLAPDSVVVYGSSTALKPLHYLLTEELDKQQVQSSFVKDLQLVIPETVIQTSHNSVRVAAAVAKFTEMDYELPIEVIHLPDSVTIKLFPPKITVQALVPIEKIDSIAVSDFALQVDFKESRLGQEKSLSVEMVQSPSMIRSMRWQPQKVEYLIRK